MSGRYGLDDLLWEHVRNAESFYSELRFSSFAHPGGHSLLTTLSFLFGQNIENVSMLTILLDSLSIIVLFFIAFVLFKKTEIAIFTSLIFAVLPWQIFISGMGLDVTSSIFFTLSAFAVLLISKELRSANLFMLSIIMFLWSAEIRLDNLIFLLLLFFVYFRAGYKIKNQKWFFPLIVTFLLPIIAWVTCSPVLFGPGSSIEGQGKEGFFSIGNLLINYSTYIIPHFFVNSYGNYYPLFIFPFLFVLGSLLFLDYKGSFYLLIIWFLGWSLVYGSFWYGSQIYRYSVFIHPVLAIVSACGAYAILNYVPLITKNKKIITALTVSMSLLIILTTFPFQSLVNPSPITFWPSVSEFKEIDKVVESDSCVVLQKLKYGRFENAKHLIGVQRTFIEWPTNYSIFGYNCTNVYYFDLRGYIHPMPEDLEEYDNNHNSLFSEYELVNVFEKQPLRVYRVIRRI
jgi:hypothetical protein